MAVANGSTPRSVPSPVCTAQQELSLPSALRGTLTARAENAPACGADSMSVVMLSATRPDNAKFITEVLSLHTKIASIIVVHALERSAQNLEPISPKVVDVHAHADAGLDRLQQIYRGGQRFFYANAAKCDSILFLDDDMLPTCVKRCAELREHWARMIRRSEWCIAGPQQFHGLLQRSRKTPSTSTGAIPHGVAHPENTR